MCRSTGIRVRLNAAWSAFLQATGHIRFSPSYLCTHLNWTCLEVTWKVSTTSCNTQLPSHWNTQPSWWLERSRCHCHWLVGSKSSRMHHSRWSLRQPGSGRWTRNLITYSYSRDSTHRDYIHHCKSFSSTINNVKVIPNEKCVKQHHIVLCDFTAHIPWEETEEVLTSYPHLKAQGPSSSRP